MKTNIRFKDRGIIGWVEKGMFFSNRDSRKHYFRKYEGYGISEDILDFLIDSKITQICLIIDNRTLLSCGPEQFLVNAIYYTDMSLGKPDKQLILPLKCWSEKLFEKIEVQTKI